MAKFRVYEIAKKYNKDNKEILEILNFPVSLNYDPVLLLSLVSTHSRSF